MDVERLALQGLADEGVDRALADLAGAVDVEGADRERRQPVLAVVVVGQVLGGQLADGVGPARFAHRADGGDVALADFIGVAAEDLAGGEVDEALDLGLAAPIPARCRCR